MGAASPGTGQDAARNRFPGRAQRAFSAYVVAVTVLGLGVAVDQCARLDVPAVLALGSAFWVVLALLVVGELRPLFTAGTRDANGIAVSVTLLFALLLGYGLPVTIAAQALAVLVADLARRRPAWRTAFNVGQYTLSWAAAGAVLAWAGSSPSPAEPVSPDGHLLLLAVLAGAVYFVVNQLLVTGAIALMSGERVRDVLAADLPQEAAVNGALLALSPLVLLTMERGGAFVPLLLPPLLAVYKVAGISVAHEEEARTDSLTGLGNRTRLVERTPDALRDGERGTGALLLFDLDRFKEVNDTLGHAVGDRLLAVVGERLTAAVRPGDLAVRLGGDEFALLLGDVTPDEAASTARRVAARLSEPVELEGVLVDVGVSIGIALSPQHGRHLDDLLQHADVAMYLAKEAGGGVVVYDPTRDRHSAARLALVGELRRALRDGELVLHYQPIADLAGGQVDAVEALVRWDHPVRGLLPPGEFVPEAERSGLMPELTRFVVDTALAQLHAWRAAGLPLRVSVNISGGDLVDEALPHAVAAALHRHGLASACLQLEVTEGSLLLDPARTAPALQRLQELGVPLSLDDFGTGWSSLTSLRRLPLHELKIDRSFVERIDVDARDAAIVRSVVDLARALGVRVVAEGVDTEQAWRQLRELGCSAAQGWYLAPAQPADRLTPWLHRQSPLVPEPLSPQR